MIDKEIKNILLSMKGEFGYQDIYDNCNPLNESDKLLVLRVLDDLLQSKSIIPVESENTYKFKVIV